MRLINLYKLTLLLINFFFQKHYFNLILNNIFIIYEKILNKKGNLILKLNNKIAFLISIYCI